MFGWFGLDSSDEDSSSDDLIGQHNHGRVCPCGHNHDYSSSEEEEQQVNQVSFPEWSGSWVFEENRSLNETNLSQAYNDDNYERKPEPRTKYKPKFTEILFSNQFVSALSIRWKLDEVLPAVNIENVGILSLPIISYQLDEINKIFPQKSPGYWEILPENLTLLNPRFDAAIKLLMINSLNGMGLDLLSLAHLTPQLRKLAIYQAGFTLPPELTEKKESDEGEMEVEENEEIIIDENEGDESRKKMITLANIVINLPSSYEGGNLSVEGMIDKSWEYKNEFEFKEKEFTTTSVTLLGNCNQNRSPIEKGHRVTLDYEVEADFREYNVPLKNQRTMSELVNLIKDWNWDIHSSKFLVILLDQYFEYEELSSSNPKCKRAYGMIEKAIERCDFSVASYFSIIERNTYRPQSYSSSPYFYKVTKSSPIKCKNYEGEYESDDLCFSTLDPKDYSFAHTQYDIHHEFPSSFEIYRNPDIPGHAIHRASAIIISSPNKNLHAEIITSKSATSLTTKFQTNFFETEGLRKRFLYGAGLFAFKAFESGQQQLMQSALDLISLTNDVSLLQHLVDSIPSHGFPIGKKIDFTSLEKAFGSGKEMENFVLGLAKNPPSSIRLLESLKSSSDTNLKNRLAEYISEKFEKFDPRRYRNYLTVEDMVKSFSLMNRMDLVRNILASPIFTTRTDLEDYDDKHAVLTPSFLLLLSNILPSREIDTLLPPMLKSSSFRGLIHSLKFPRSAGVNDFVFRICCLVNYTNQEFCHFPLEVIHYIMSFYSGGDSFQSIIRCIANQGLEKLSAMNRGTYQSAYLTDFLTYISSHCTDIPLIKEIFLQVKNNLNCSNELINTLSRILPADVITMLIQHFCSMDKKRILETIFNRFTFVPMNKVNSLTQAERELFKEAAIAFNKPSFNLNIDDITQPSNVIFLFKCAYFASLPFLPRSLSLSSSNFSQLSTPQQPDTPQVDNTKLLNYTVTKLNSLINAEYAGAERIFTELASWLGISDLKTMADNRCKEYGAKEFENLLEAFLVKKRKALGPMETTTVGTNPCLDLSLSCSCVDNKCYLVNNFLKSKDLRISVPQAQKKLKHLEDRIKYLNVTTDVLNFRKERADKGRLYCLVIEKKLGAKIEKNKREFQNLATLTETLNAVKKITFPREIITPSPVAQHSTPITPQGHAGPKNSSTMTQQKQQQQKQQPSLSTQPNQPIPLSPQLQRIEFLNSAIANVRQNILNMPNPSPENYARATEMIAIYTQELNLLSNATPLPNGSSSPLPMSPYSPYPYYNASYSPGMGPGMPPLGPSYQPGMGPLGPSYQPGMGPMGPSYQPGMGPLGPSYQPGMGPMGPMGATGTMGPMGPGMGAAGPMGPMGPGMGATGPMGPMGPGMPPLGPSYQPGMGPLYLRNMGHEVAPIGSGMRPNYQPGMGPVGQGMGSGYSQSLTPQQQIQASNVKKQDEQADSLKRKAMTNSMKERNGNEKKRKKDQEDKGQDDSTDSF